MRGTGHGPHGPVLDIVVDTVMVQGDCVAHLVLHSSRLQWAACGIKHEDKDEYTVANGTDAPGVVPVNTHSFAAQGGGRRVY